MGLNPFPLFAVFLAVLICRPSAPSEEPPAAPRTAAPGTVKGAAEEASPAEADAFLEAWGKRSREVRSLAIRFRQEKKLRILRRPRVSEGDLVYADGKLSVIVRGLDGEVESELLLRDGKLKIHYPRLKKVEVIDIGGGAGPPAGGGGGLAIPFFAMDPKDLRRDFAVSLVRRREAAGGPAAEAASEGKSPQSVLTLTPRDPKSPVKRLEMVFDGLDIREYGQLDLNGDEARMTILSAEMNAEVPAGRFDLKVAEGTTESRLDGR